MIQLIRFQFLVLILFALNEYILKVTTQEENGNQNQKDEKRRYMADLRNEKKSDDIFEVLAYVNDIKYTNTQAQEIYMGVLDLLKYRWPSSTIPVTVSSDFKPVEKIVIWRTLAIIEKDTCIRFIAKRFQDENYVSVTKNYWQPIQSNLGAIGGKQCVNLHSANYADKYTILHLFMHTLGFPHQHVVPNRDEHIQVLWGNISQMHKSEFVKLTKLVMDEDVFDDYDVNSIMHYDSYAGTSSGAPTLLTKDGKFITPFGSITPKDIEKLNKFYACL